MLVEMGFVEQRYKAVLEVLNDGATVTDVDSALWSLPGDPAPLARVPKRAWDLGVRSPSRPALLQ